MWVKGRQGTGYLKLKIFQLKFIDCYILKYPKGSNIPFHTDPVSEKRHYRFNFILKRATGGDFLCKGNIFKFWRMIIFRPDLHEHAVTEVISGNRYVFSLGIAV